MQPLTQVKDKTRNDIVPYYVDLIKTDPSNDEVVRVNQLILSKWKPSGLIYIKEKAWKIVDNIKIPLYVNT